MSEYLIKFLVFSTLLLGATASRALAPFLSPLDEKRYCVLTKKVHINVVNAIPSSSLWLHIVKGNDDKGYRVLSTDEEFHFDFCYNPKDPDYVCTALWAGKTSTFYLFKYDQNICENDTCYFEARSDGIYCPDDSNHQQLKKIQGWS
ncbi:Unknown protein [Striga hermonthica]|uniref:S-protein homolog n=1 Tax=Striga hermonthica TaxID=68872 RepID=A0A9N7NP07_STRHE|nr:Unknown protein [Striga hermonthica]